MAPPRLVFAALGCLLVAGCVGGPSGSSAGVDGGSATAGTIAPTTDVASTTTTLAPTSTADQPAYGTQFVSVEEYENQSREASWPDDERSTFENLTEAQRDVFLRALEDGQQRFGPDGANPFDWNDADRPVAVQYEGTWYHVRVAIV